MPTTTTEKSHNNINKQPETSETIGPEPKSLLEAARLKNWDRVKELIQQGAKDFDEVLEEGENAGKSALWLAAYQLQWKLVENMIERGAKGFDSTSQTGSDAGKSALWWAAYSSQWKLVETMIERGAKGFDSAPPTGLNAGMSALWLAAVDKQWKLVEAMIERGVKDFDKAPQAGHFARESALCFAASDRQWKLVDAMIERGAKSFDSVAQIGEHTGKSALWCAAYGSQWKLVESMIERGAKGFDSAPQTDSLAVQSMLRLAAYGAQWKLVKNMIERGAKGFDSAPQTGPNAGQSALWWAASFQQWKLVETMIERGAKGFDSAPQTGPDAGISVLWWAASSKQWKLVQTIIKLGARGFDSAPIAGSRAYQTVLSLAKQAKQHKLVSSMLKLQSKVKSDIVESQSKAKPNAAVLALAAKSLLERMNVPHAADTHAKLDNPLSSQAKNKAELEGLVQRCLSTQDPQTIASITEFLRENISNRVLNIKFKPFSATWKLGTLRKQNPVYAQHALFESELGYIEYTEAQFSALIKFLEPKALLEHEREQGLRDFLLQSGPLKQKHEQEQRRHCEEQYFKFIQMPNHLQRKKLWEDFANRFKEVNQVFPSLLKSLEEHELLVKALQANPPEKFKKNPQSLLNTIQSRQKNAQASYAEILNLFENKSGKSNLSTIQNAFHQAYESAKPKMLAFRRESNLAGMEACLQDLEKYSVEAERLLKAVGVQLELLKSISGKTQEDMTSLYQVVQHQHMAQVEQAAKLKDEHRAKEEAQLLEIKAAFEKEQAFAQAQEAHKARYEKSLIWKKKAQELHERFLKNQPRRAVTVQPVASANGLPVAPRTLVLSDAVMPVVQENNFKLNVQKHWQDFQNLLSEFAQDKPDEAQHFIYPYALLGKWAQVMHAIAERTDTMGKLAKELRNTLYHAPKELLDFTHPKHLENLVDTVFTLFHLDWQNNNALKTAILPKLFVKLVCYPRNLKGLSEEVLSTLNSETLWKWITDFDSQAQTQNRKMGYLKISNTLPALKASYRHYREVWKQIDTQLQQGQIPKFTAIYAMGYIEGLINSCITEAGRFKGLEEARELIIAPRFNLGKAFRHNRLKPQALEQGYDTKKLHLALIHSQKPTTHESIPVQASFTDCPDAKEMAETRSQPPAMPMLPAFRERQSVAVLNPAVINTKEAAEKEALEKECTSREPSAHGLLEHLGTEVSVLALQNQAKPAVTASAVASSK